MMIASHESKFFKIFGMKLSRLVAGMLLVIVFLFLRIVTLGVTSAIHSDSEFGAVDGKVDLAGFSPSNYQTHRLTGQWEQYAGMCLCTNGLTDYYLQTPEMISLPVPLANTPANNAYNNSIFKLRIFHEYEIDTLSIYLRPIRGDFRVILNGQPIKSEGMFYDDFPIASMSNVPVFTLPFDNNLEYQALIISVCDTVGFADFYNSQFIIGTTEAVRSLFIVKATMWALTIGFISMLVISRGIFMVLCPEYKIISLYTMMDLCIIIRVLFGIPELYHAMEFVLGLSIAPENIARIRFIAIMLVGVASVILTNQVFNTDNKTCKLICRVTAILVAVMSIFALINISNLRSYYVIYILTGLAICCVAYTTYCVISFARKNKLRRVHILKSILLLVTAVVVIYDIIGLRDISGGSLTSLPIYFALSLLYLINDLSDKNDGYKNYIKLAGEFQEVSVANDQIKELSIRDSMTGIYNRFYFETEIRDRVLKCESTQTNLFLAVLDLDHFKRINDTYGHDVGDEQIKEFADIIQRLIPKGFVSARFGGEEFVVLAEDISYNEFLEALANIRVAMEDIANKNEKRTTVSIGATKLEDGMTFKDFFKSADTCLYEAKNAGRNRIVAR